MLPYVGPDYESPTHVRMLLVGESNYFPKSSLVHKESRSWYEKSQADITPEEEAYINCRGLLECDWKAPGHKIYRELNACLALLELPCTDRPVSHVAYMNAFQRPAAVPGSTFKHCCTDIDVEIGLETLKSTVAIIDAEVVVFVSKYAWDKIGKRVRNEQVSGYYDYVSHPADPFHWNVPSYKHGKSKFVDLLRSRFIKIPNSL